MPTPCEQQKKLLGQNIAKEKVLHRIPTEDEVIFFFNNFIQGNIDSLEYNRYLIDILVNSIYLSDEEDGTQKMTVLLNTQNSQETVTLNDLTQRSSNVHMVHHRGLSRALKTPHWGGFARRTGGGPELFSSPDGAPD